jgi:NTE family protein
MTSLLNLEVERKHERNRTREERMGSAIGLVITGGGARGAYQAGVLKRIGEIPRVNECGNPFPLIGGASAGAVNGAALAAGCDDFSAATKTLAKLWAGLRPTDIFHCDLA